jgi:hypothetical protein
VCGVRHGTDLASAGLAQRSGVCGGADAGHVAGDGAARACAAHAAGTLHGDTGAVGIGRRAAAARALAGVDIAGSCPGTCLQLLDGMHKQVKALARTSSNSCNNISHTLTVPRPVRALMPGQARSQLGPHQPARHTQLDALAILAAEM